MIGVRYAIEDADNSNRQYLAGSPYYPAIDWDGGETQQRFRVQRAIKAESAVMEAKTRFRDLGQQVLTVDFATRRSFSTVRAALLAAFRQATAHRWGGTAVMMVREQGSMTRWKIYRCPKAVLNGSWYVQGCSLHINYQFTLGAWTYENTEVLGAVLTTEDGVALTTEDGRGLAKEG